MSLKDKILKSKVVETVVQFLDGIVLPGLDGLSLYKIGSFFVEGIRKGYVTTRAYALAFRFFLALFPLIIFLFTLIPFIPIENFQQELLFVLQSVIPESAFNLATETIDDIVNTPRGGLLSIGFVLAIYFASNGINAMIDAFNKSYHVLKKGNFWKQRLNSLILLFVLTFLVMLAIALMTFGSDILEHLTHELDLVGTWFETLFTIVEIIIVVLLYFLGFSFIYYFGNVRSEKFRFISAGSTIATVLSLLLTYGFSYYVNHFGSYNRVYGSIGALIVILLWIYLNSLVLLIGYELNASIRHAQYKQNRIEDEIV